MEMKTLRTIFCFITALLASSANAQVGSWNGELNIMDTKLPLVFNFSTNECTFDSPSQGVKGIPAEKTLNDDGTIILKIEAIGATFEGKMSDGEIKGTFMQNVLPFHSPLNPERL